MLFAVQEQLEDKLIRYLANDPATTAEVLHAKFHTYSVQAIYKTLRKLQREGIVIKDGLNYTLRLPWVLEMTTLLDTLHSNYTERATNLLLPSIRHKKMVWQFTSLLRLNELWSQVLLLLVQQSKTKQVFGWNPHTWFHLAQTKQEAQYIRSLKLAKSKLYLIVGSKSPLDQWAEQFWNKSVVTHSTAQSYYHTTFPHMYLNVIDDYVITVAMGENTRLQIDRIYRSTHSLVELDIAAIIRLFNERTKAQITLEYSPAKARMHKKRFYRYFGIKD